LPRMLFDSGTNPSTINDAKKHAIFYWYKASPDEVAVHTDGSTTEGFDSYGVICTNGTPYQNGTGCIQADTACKGTATMSVITDDLQKCSESGKMCISFWIMYEDLITEFTVYPFCLVSRKTGTTSTDTTNSISNYDIIAALELTTDSIRFRTAHYESGSSVSNYMNEGKWNHILIQMEASKDNDDCMMNLFVNGTLVSTLSTLYNASIEDSFYTDYAMLTATNRLMYQVANIQGQSTRFQIADFVVFDDLMLPKTEYEYDVPLNFPFADGTNCTLFKVSNNMTNDFGDYQTPPQDSQTSPHEDQVITVAKSVKAIRDPNNPNRIIRVEYDYNVPDAVTGASLASVIGVPLVITEVNDGYVTARLQSEKKGTPGRYHIYLQDVRDYNSSLASKDLDSIKIATYFFGVQMNVPTMRIPNKLGKTYFVGTVKLDTSDQRLVVDIPYPYKKFTDMEFFCTKLDGTLIPEYYYKKINNNTQIVFNPNTIQITVAEDIRFTFCHKHGFYHVQKYEQTNFLKDGEKKVKFNSPYNRIVNLFERVRVFIDRKFIWPDVGVYMFDNNTGIADFKKLSPGKHEIDFLCFYTGTKKNDYTVPKLPMSGYIEFMKRHADRVWDKNLFAAFVNGTLISRDDIKDMTSRIHKIKRDIKTRYNLEVLNLSPRLSYLTPYLKMKYAFDNDASKQSHPWNWEFPITMKVYYPDKEFDDRYIVEPNNTTLNPIEYKPLVPDNLDYYITLMHHGQTEFPDGDYVSYDLSFYRDKFWDKPDIVSVFAMVRPKGNEEEFYPDTVRNVRYTQHVDAAANSLYYTNDTDPRLNGTNHWTLMGTLPPIIKNIGHDVPYFSIKARDVYDNDIDTDHLKPDAVDGIMCRMSILQTMKDFYHHLYYSLNTTYYEFGTEVGVFEWVISSERDGAGQVYYRKTISLVPTNDVGPNIYDSEYDDETFWNKHENQYWIYDWIYDNDFKVGTSMYLKEENELWIDPNAIYTDNSIKPSFIERIKQTTSYAASTGVEYEKKEEELPVVPAEKQDDFYYIFGSVTLKDPMEGLDRDKDGIPDGDDGTGETKPDPDKDSSGSSSDKDKDNEFKEIIYFGPIRSTVKFDDYRVLRDIRCFCEFVP